jgi:hypothetical protein
LPNSRDDMGKQEKVYALLPNHGSLNFYSMAKLSPREELRLKIDDHSLQYYSLRRFVRSVHQPSRHLKSQRLLRGYVDIALVRIVSRHIRIAAIDAIAVIRWACVRHVIAPD